PEHTFPSGAVTKFEPDFSQNQFGFTLGGPLKRDRAFYFLAYDQQIYDEVKQKNRTHTPAYDSLVTFLASRYPELASDFSSIARGNHLFKFGGEWNRTATTQVFVGFANGRMAFNSVTGFINYVTLGSGYRECSNGTTSTTGACPGGTSVVGPVNLYLQQAGV